jgi:DNA-binding transcriptional ArsR family regulator
LTCDYLVTYSADVDAVTEFGPEGGMDPVFRALADPSRRRLLDRLREHDGQSLTELCEAIPDMTRFGVMKHLAVLEEAHLVVTERHGRAKHHYLNPIPIRQIHDRWISKYAEPFASALVELAELRDGA